MKRGELAVLEKIFTCEINNRLPAQLKSKFLPALEEDGCVVQVEAVLPGRFPVKIHGWCLTERGRILYCESCRERT